MSLFWVRAACEIRLTYYCSKYSPQFLSDTFVPILSRITWTLQVHVIERVLSKTFLCGLELHERSNWRATAPDTHHDCSLIQHCLACAASLHLHRYLLRNCELKQNFRSLWLHYTPNDDFTSNNASFYKSRFCQLHDICCRVFPITVLYFLIRLASTHALIHCN